MKRAFIRLYESNLHDERVLSKRYDEEVIIPLLFQVYKAASASVNIYICTLDTTHNEKSVDNEDQIEQYFFLCGYSET